MLYHRTKRQVTLVDYYCSLSRRERQVLWFVVDGLPDKATAAEMGIALVTVKVHRSNVMRKMHAAHLPALVRMADKISMDLARQ